MREPAQFCALKIINIQVEGFQVGEQGWRRRTSCQGVFSCGRGRLCQHGCSDSGSRLVFESEQESVNLKSKQLQVHASDMGAEAVERSSKLEECFMAWEIPSIRRKEGDVAVELRDKD